MYRRRKCKRLDDLVGVAFGSLALIAAPAFVGNSALAAQHHKAEHSKKAKHVAKDRIVLAGYRGATYRGDWYGYGYYYGGSAPIRRFWGKGTTGLYR